MTSRITRCGLAVWACGLLGLSGCAPPLDWRETRVEGSDLQVLFPCRPTTHQRRVPVAGLPMALSLTSCGAAQQTWGVSWTDAGEPARVDAVLAALAETAAGNVGLAPASALPQAVAGATPQPRSGRLRLQGRLPDGNPVRMQVLLFARGTQVFQAIAVGQDLSDDAVETFLGSLRFSAP